MAKIIKLTEQDLYRIVKRVLNEEKLLTEGSNPIIDMIVNNPSVKLCLKENSGELFGIGLDVLLNCKSCRGLGLDVVIELVLGGKDFDPTTLDKTKVKECASEALDYYSKNEKDREQMVTAVTTLVTCIADKVVSGDLPIDKTDIDTSKFPIDFPIPNEDEIGDMINKGTDMIKTGIDTVIKNMPSGKPPVMRSK